jgi:hypothetical protein
MSENRENNLSPLTNSDADTNALLMEVLRTIALSGGDSYVMQLLANLAISVFLKVKVRIVFGYGTKNFIFCLILTTPIPSDKTE